MDWLWHALISRLTWEIILVCGGAGLLGYLKKKVPEHAATLAYGVFGATCVAILLFAITGHGFLFKPAPVVTAENLEENLEKWAENNGLGVTKVPSTVAGQDAYFGFVVTLNSGNQIMVFRGKDKAGFVQIQSSLVLSQEHLAMLNKLSKEQADDAIEEITLEMNRSRIGFVMQTATLPPAMRGLISTTTPTTFGQTILVTKPLSLSDADEQTFIARLDAIDSEIGIVRGVTDLTLKRYSREADAMRRSSK